MARNEPKIYKHSNIKSIILKVIVLIIVAAIILALTAFFGFRKFIAYTDTGKLYLDIPWLYGYMPGPPTEDDLAPYLEPVNKDPISNVATKVEDTSSEDGDNTDDTTSTESGVPQYVDPTPSEEDEGE